MLEYASDVVKTNREVVKEAVEQNGLALKFAVDTLQNDPELIVLALKTYSKNESYFFQNALVTVMQNGLDLEKLPFEMKKNKDIVMAAVKQNGLALQFASDELKNDRQIAFLAVDNNKDAMEFVGTNILDCIKSVLKIMETLRKRYVVSSLKAIVPELFSIREFILKIIPLDSSFYPDKEFHNDREIIKIGCQYNEAYLAKASQEIRNDKPFILSCIELSGGKVLQYATLNLQNDKEVVLAAIKMGATLQYVSEELGKVKEVVLAAVEVDGNLQYVPDELKKDKDIVLTAIRKGNENQLPAILLNESDNDILLEAVKKDGYALRHIHTQKHTKLIVEAAIKQNSLSSRYASIEALAQVIKADDNLKNNKNFFGLIFDLPGYGVLLEYASNDLKKDKTLILAAMKTDKKGLQFADEQFRKDRTFILTETDLDDTILQFTSDELKNDGDFIQKLVVKKGITGIDYLKYASDTLKANKDFIELMVGKNVRALKYASQALRKDKVFLARFDTEKYEYPRCRFFEFVDDELKNDFDYVKNVVSKMGPLLEFASQSLRDNREIVLAAVQARGISIRYASDRFKKDRELALIAVKQDSRAFEYIDTEFQSDKTFVIEVVKIHPDILEFEVANNIELSKKFLGDKEVILASLESQDPSPEGGIRYASTELLDDSDFMLKALEKNDNIIGWFSDRLKQDESSMYKAVKIEKKIFEHHEFRNKDFVKMMVKKDASLFPDLPTTFRTDKGFILELLDANKDVQNFIPIELKDDTEIAAKIVFLNAAN